MYETTLTTLTEELIIEGLERRDKVVFDYVFNYYYSSLCAFSMQYLNDRNAVEDLVQDFFVTLWMESANRKIRISLKSYLFSGIRYRCLDFQKHQKVVRKYNTFAHFFEEMEVSQTDHFFAESELRQAIHNSMAKLPPRCNEIFGLSRIKGLSNQEIASHLGLSKRTVELQISNALKILRKELVEYLPACIIAWFLIQS